MKLRIPIFSLTVLLLLSYGWAAQDTDLGPPLWTGIALEKHAAGPENDRLPHKYALFGLDREALAIILEQAPMEFLKGGASLPVIELPTPDGELARFLFEESPILSEELSLEYPHIRTYRAQGLDDPTLTTRFDLTSSGFHAMVFSSDGTWLIDPHPGGDDLYMAYHKRDAQKGEPFRCLVEDAELPVQEPLDILEKISPNNPSGTELRTYRLAVTSTDEYWVWADDEGSDAASEITTTINRVTGIYERDVAIRFNIVYFNIYDNDPAGSDPFINVVNSALLTANDDDLDSKLGSDGYDIGHILSQGGGGGLASCGACQDNKGRGATSRDDPSGDAFDVDYVAHEMGHQLCASHTFNGTSGSCGGSNRVDHSAYEPGSGSTIMAYAGICGDEDVEPHTDDDFHTRSFDQIREYLDTGKGNDCGTVTPTYNTVPIVDAGPDYTIPRETPFTLTATGSDADFDALTYSWEQYDLGAATTVPPTGSSTGPLFRSRPRTSNPSRTLPQMADLLSGAATTWEVLPTVDRDLNFRVTARDGGGGSDWDAMQIEVSGSPFFITSPAGGDTWECGDDDSIEWIVEGSSLAANVKASFSSDNGVNFTTALASTSNDGDAEVTVPKTLTTNARYKLEAIGNIFFDVSGPFSIVDTGNPSITAPPDLGGVECTSPEGASPALGSPTVSDQCDASPSVTNDASGPLPLGTTGVTWTATDASGNSWTDTQQVTVVDTTAPTITAPGDITAECASPLGTPVDIGTASAADVCDLSPVVSNDAPGLFPLGSTVVTWTATDATGNANSDGQAITIADTTPPQFTTLELSPTVLWPANHKMVTINATIAVEDICDAALQVRLVSITSNQPDDGLGDGATEADIQGAAIGTDDRQFQLRAERSGVAGPRIYTVVYEVEDASGNTTQGSVEVVVPFSGTRGRGKRH